MATNLMASPVLQLQDGNGNPLAGGKAFFYFDGTSTPAAVYQDNALTTPHDVPIVADATGNFGAIYLTPNVLYSVTIKDSDDNVVQTIGKISAQPYGLPPGGSNGFPVLKASATDGDVSFGGLNMDMGGFNINNAGDVNAERLILETQDFPFLVLSIDNDNASPVTATFDFKFNGVRSFSFGAHNNLDEFVVASYDSTGTFKGYALTVARSTGASMANALVINADKSVDFGGDIDATGVVKIDGTQVVGNQQSAIADSSGGDEQTKINDILAALRAHGLIAT